MSNAVSYNSSALRQVTLVAVTSVNVQATLAAFKASMAQMAFGGCKFLSDVRPAGLPAGVDFVKIARVTSAAEYSDYILRNLADHVETSHCLIIQWDGHVLDGRRWLPEFLDHDFVGASWPQFGDGHDVGNGGFSLRSRQLLEACRAADFKSVHPEDLAIGRHNRNWLEARGMRFAPRTLADRFSAERAGDPSNSFGYHGVWHMPRVLGVEEFWNIYRSLDDRTTIRHDFGSLFKDLVRGNGGAVRGLGLIKDRLRDAIG